MSHTLRSRRPRVLRIITRLAVSGVSTHVTLVNQELTKRGWETLLVYGRVQPDELEIDLPIAGVRTAHLPELARPIDPRSDARAAAGILRLIRRFRPDIIHSHHSKAGLLGRSTAILAGIPRVHTFHGHVFEGYFGSRSSAAIVATERILAMRTSHLIALSPRQREDILQRGIGRADRFSVVPLGLDLARFGAGDKLSSRDRLGVSQDITAVVMIGRLVPIKRVDRLLRAFAIAYSQRPDLRLFIIGDGSERMGLEAQAAAAGLAAAVTFCGWRSDTEDWYAAADIVALSSDNEGTPLSLIEAAAASRPVVATDVGGVRDVVSHGESGLLVEAQDESGLASALVRLASDRLLAQRLGQAGPGTAQQFGIGRLTDDLERLYCSLIPLGSAASESRPSPTIDEVRSDP